MENVTETSQNYKNGRPLRANRGKNPNARWLVDDPEPKRPAKRRKGRSDKTASKQKAEEEITEGEVKCRCDGKVSDDKTMAECENCKTWQHIICEFGVDDESALPKPKYFCYGCREDEDADENNPRNKKLAKSGENTDKVGSKGIKSESADTGDSTEDNGRKIAGIEDPVRRSAAEAFSDILQEKTDENSSENKDSAEVENLALDIEQALYDKFAEKSLQDVGTEYREQYRMLNFNLRDPKNRWLRKELSSGKLTPSKFAGMTSEELRNPELQQVVEQVQKENLRESVLPNVAKPPMEIIKTDDAEVNTFPTYLEYKQEDKSDEADQDDAMKEPLGPEPTIDAINIGNDFTRDSSAVPSDNSESKHSEVPVWLGTLKLEDDAISLKAKGLHVAGESRNKWPSLTGSDLIVEGLMQKDRGLSFLSAITDKDDRSLAILAVISDDLEKISELYDYLHSRDRFGSLQRNNEEVTDAYLLPFENMDALNFIDWDKGQEAFLKHLKTEHDDHKVLLAVYVVKSPAQ